MSEQRKDRKKEIEKVLRDNLILITDDNGHYDISGFAAASNALDAYFTKELEPLKIVYEHNKKNGWSIEPLLEMAIRTVVGEDKL